MKILYFEQTTDDRFDKDIYNLLNKRVEKLKELLTIDGVEVKTGTIYNVDFGTNKQYRCKFYVSKKTKKTTWNDIYKIVNSVKAVNYKFIEI
jgi:hypothetical protein